MHKYPMFNYNRLFSPYLNTIIVTQEELDKFKAENIKKEIAGLEELIEDHRASITRLQQTISIIAKELPAEKAQVTE